MTCFSWGRVNTAEDTWTPKDPRDLYRAFQVGIFGLLLQECFFFFFAATPVTYGSSRAKGQVQPQLLAYSTAAATPDPSHICNLCDTLRQQWILNPLHPQEHYVRFEPAEPQWERNLRILYLFFLGLHPWHMEVPKLGAESELQLPAYTTAAATPDLSCVGDLHHSSW